MAADTLCRSCAFLLLKDENILVNNIVRSCSAECTEFPSLFSTKFLSSKTDTPISFKSPLGHSDFNLSYVYLRFMRDPIYVKEIGKENTTGI